MTREYHAVFLFAETHTNDQYMTPYLGRNHGTSRTIGISLPIPAHTRTIHCKQASQSSITLCVVFDDADMLEYAAQNRRIETMSVDTALFSHVYSKAGEKCR